MNVSVIRGRSDSRLVNRRLGQLGDEEQVEKISRKSRNDHERDPL
jgi:hypothetical protein